MILDKIMTVVVNSNNLNHWRSKGYEFDYMPPRWGKPTRIKVRTSELPEKSMIKVEMVCDRCGEHVTRMFKKISSYCKSCSHHFASLGNTSGRGNKGKTIPSMRGSNHPRWNPDRPRFLKYSSQVHHLTEKTYVKYKDRINPENYPRTLCGVDGGYQLDHITSIKDGFIQGISASKLAALNNLRMLPWQENLARRNAN